MSFTIVHGDPELPSVTVDAYNAELRDSDGFIGDRASNRAFRSLLDDHRGALDEDPLGDTASSDISKRALDKALVSGSPEAAGIVHSTIEDFAQEFAAVIRRFLKLKEWKQTERIVVGGGLRGSRVGELAIGRTTVLLHKADVRVELVPIRHHPDEAGLLGGAHLAPAWIFKGHDSILAMDIGGTNVRAGIVALNNKRAPDLARSEVVESELWRHRDDTPTREQAVDRMLDMLRDLIRRAEKKRMNLAPFVAVGCPGLITASGAIERGGQNLPGDWEHAAFHLPSLIREGVPRIGDDEVHVVMHNDAVVQGLSEVPFMQDVTHWGVMTIGTGLGNARFTNRSASA